MTSSRVREPVSFRAASSARRRSSRRLQRQRSPRLMSSSPPWMRAVRVMVERRARSMGRPVAGASMMRGWAGSRRWSQASRSWRLRRLPMGISRSGRVMTSRSKSTCGHVSSKISPGCIFSFQLIHRAIPTREPPSCCKIRQRRYSRSCILPGGSGRFSSLGRKYWEKAPRRVETAMPLTRAA